MGWDFMYPTDTQRQTGYVGNIREVDGVGDAAALVDAVRLGLTEAIKTRNSTEIDPPLRAFWSKHAGYAPQHTGRCYPHGHAEVTDARSSIECQSATLQRVAMQLIAAANSAPGAK